MKAESGVSGFNFGKLNVQSRTNVEEPLFIWDVCMQGN